ncbi:UPF0104 family protein [Candidatus Saccharibacteria bacterium]|nr:UPF0104 family protein [Candidatus Saccharibacteria bacterium]
MKSKKIAITSVSLAICAIFGFIVVSAPKASSVTSENSTILAKAYKEGVYQSYAQSCMKTNFNAQQIATGSGGVNNGFGHYATNQVSDNCSAKFPPVYFDDTTYGNAGHVALEHFYDGQASGGNSLGFPDAITKVSGGSKTDPTKGGGIDDAGYTFLDGMNYEKGGTSGEVCFRIWYDYWSVTWGVLVDVSTQDVDKFSHPLCSKVDDNGVMTDDPYVNSEVVDWSEEAAASTNIVKFEVKKSKDKVLLDCATMEGFFGSFSTVGATAGAVMAGITPHGIGLLDVFGNGKCEGMEFTYTPGSTKFSDLRDGVITQMVNNAGVFDWVSGTVLNQTYHEYRIWPTNYQEKQGQLVESVTLNLKGGSATDRGLNAVKYLTGNSSFKYSDLKLSQDETIILYSAYVRNYYTIASQLPKDSSDTIDKSQYRLIKLLNFDGEKAGKLDELYIKVNNGTSKVPGIRVANQSNYSDSGLNHLVEDVDWDQIADYLGGLPATKTSVDPTLLEQNKPTSATTTVPGDQPTEGDQNQDPADTCYTKAGSLGWIVCPIIEEVSTFVREKYAQWVEPALQINTNLFGADGSKDTYNAWNIFRNIANVFFVIIFLVIIFSQLTGVGIDNYGIKKILPKLIIGAILINVSYIICQLAIDVANIVGYGVAGIFKSISTAIGDPQSITLEGVTVSGQDGEVGWLEGGGGLTLVVLAVVGAISAIAVLSQGTAIIIPVLLAVLGIAISLFTLIAILGMRQAAAVLLVVGSPLAFVAYMLPNTKKLFDKWLKVFEGLLIAFPACSALIYGGDMVGRILLNSANGSTWVVISAGIVSIAPIFYIPKLIKTSMGAVSNVASRLSGGLNKAARGAVNGSQWAKNLRADSEYARNRRSLMHRAGMKIGKDGQLSYRGGKDRKHPLTTRGKMKLDAARSELANDVIARGGAGRYTGDEGLARLNSRIYKEQEKEELADVSGAQSRIMLGHTQAVNAKGDALEAVGKDGKLGPVMIDPQNIDQLKDALTDAMRKNNSDDIKALQNILTAKGDAGREAVRSATQAFENESVYTEDGKFDEAEYNKHREAIKTAADNIMQNHAKDYKDNNRSMYDWAASNAGGGLESAKQKAGYGDMSETEKQQWMAKNAPTLSVKHNAMSVANVKSDTLIGMDDRELERLYSSVMSGTDGENIAELHNMIGQALSSQAITGAKQDRQRILKEFQDNLKMRYNEPDVKKPTPPKP